MNPHGLFERLVDFERRVRHLYLIWGAREHFSPELRFFWNCMAEDERHHLAILERSVSLLDLMELTPEVADDVLTGVEEKVTTAEAAAEQELLPSDEALRQAVILEGSELNHLDEAWFRGFQPKLTALLHAMMPEEEVHLRRLVEAVHTFSSDEALQDKAALLWSTYQQQRLKAS